jgi:hypothetical protein
MGLGNSRDYPRTYIGTDAPTHGEEIWIDSDATPVLDADLDCAEYDLDNVGNIIHNEVAVTDMVIQNVDLDKDIVFKCNDGSVETVIMQLDGSAGQLSGIVKATTGVLSAATSGTDYAPGTAALATGIVKSTTSTGALSIAASFTDYMPVLVPYRGIDALRTLDATDYFVDCTANSFDVTLPSASGIAGRVYIVKNSGTGSIGVKPTGAEKIDGLSQVDLVTQYASITVISDGTNWKIV